MTNGRRHRCLEQAFFGSRGEICRRRSIVILVDLLVEAIPAATALASCGGVLTSVVEGDVDRLEALVVLGRHGVGIGASISSIEIDVVGEWSEQCAR